MIKEELFTLSFPYYTGRNRKVRVYVPEHEEAERLPVIYMTDGQNLFEDNNPGQFGCWYTREAISEVGKAIIVGIHNDESPLQRARELTTKSIGALRFPDAMPESIRNSIVPEGELFDNFAVNTVIPEIEKRFPVQKGRNAAAFCGSSSGGLQAYFTALSHPDKMPKMLSAGRRKRLEKTSLIYIFTAAQMAEWNRRAARARRLSLKRYPNFILKRS